MTAYGVNAAYKLLCQPKRSCGAGCKYSADYYKSKKQWHSDDPKPGDQIFFWPKNGIGGSSMQHTGLVTGVDNTYVYTVEGNTSSDSGVVDNGGSVNAKKYKLSYERIAGYGRPDFDSVDPDEDLQDEQTVPNEEASPMYIATAVVSPETGSGVNFRRSPSKSAARVSGCMTIKAGEQVNVLSVEDGWAKIDYKGYSGYMMTEYLDITYADGEGPLVLALTPEQLAASIMELVNQLVQMAK